VALSSYARSIALTQLVGTSNRSAFAAFPSNASYSYPASSAAAIVATKRRAAVRARAASSAR
jgi:hypothetical protein